MSTFSWGLIFSAKVNKDAITLETGVQSLPPAWGYTVMGCIIFGK